MTFTEANTVEAHLRDWLAGPTPARPTKVSPGYARMVARIENLRWASCQIFFKLISVPSL